MQRALAPRRLAAARGAARFSRWLARRPWAAAGNVAVAVAAVRACARFWPAAENLRPTRACRRTGRSRRSLRAHGAALYRVTLPAGRTHAALRDRTATNGGSTCAPSPGMTGPARLGLPSRLPARPPESPSHAARRRPAAMPAARTLLGPTRADGFDLGEPDDGPGASDARHAGAHAATAGRMRASSPVCVRGPWRAAGRRRRGRRLADAIGAAPRRAPGLPRPANGAAALRRWRYTRRITRRGPRPTTCPSTSIRTAGCTTTRRRSLALMCPHCQVFTHITAVSVPQFSELVASRPNHVGVVYRCDSCSAPIFLKFAVKMYAANRVELANNFVELERAREKFNFTYLPENVETAVPRSARLLFGRLLQCVRVDVPAHGAGGVPRPRRQRPAADLRADHEARELAEIDPETFGAVKKVLFGADPDPTRSCRTSARARPACCSSSSKTCSTRRTSARASCSRR